jgi:hypothetical protein
MRRKLLTFTLMTTLAAVAACSGASGGDRRSDSHRQGTAQPQASATVAPVAAPAHGPGTDHARAADPHGIGGVAGRVPAFVTNPVALKSLAPTLAPETFTGKRRAGYEAARAIPETLAQLPCYCHCDRGFGHKSLHSCFVDDHGANCSICLDEALLAYQLQTEEKLKPEQIRERIIAKYGAH